MSGLRFGVFAPPYHHPRHNAALAIEHDLQLIEFLDQIGFESAWFGEHHSGGYEFIPMPELMIAAAAQRTSRIRLATGVVSLPYHHPFMVADRMAFLDHLTRGRLIFGIGPGALPGDSSMMGIDYQALRGRMEESLEAILELPRFGRARLPQDRMVRNTRRTSATQELPTTAPFHGRRVIAVAVRAPPRRQARTGALVDRRNVTSGLRYTGPDMVDHDRAIGPARP